MATYQRDTNGPVRVPAFEWGNVNKPTVATLPRSKAGARTISNLTDSLIGLYGALLLVIKYIDSADTRSYNMNQRNKKISILPMYITQALGDISCMHLRSSCTVSICSYD